MSDLARGGHVDSDMCGGEAELVRERVVVGLNRAQGSGYPVSTISASRRVARSAERPGRTRAYNRSVVFTSS
jgi:hypothetical protein